MELTPPLDTPIPGKETHFFRNLIESCETGRVLLARPVVSRLDQNFLQLQLLNFDSFFILVTLTFWPSPKFVPVLRFDTNSPDLLKRKQLLSFPKMTRFYATHAFALHTRTIYSSRCNKFVISVLIYAPSELSPLSGPGCLFPPSRGFITGALPPW
jgi:hypothetical protein